MCPISVTDTSIHLIRKFASAELQDYLLPKMLSGRPRHDVEGHAVHDRARRRLRRRRHRNGRARKVDGKWRLYGDKWFCSHADADVALLLARPEGAPAGTRGLALFALPRRLKDGSRNAYRIVRLKDKLGTRSMASGEILLEGAVAYLVGEADRGLKQMMEQVNLSRLSHGVRAAAMMRRCVNEAMICARHRAAFGKTIIDYPLLRRQLLKLIVPAEQSLSMFLFAASAMDRANAGSKAGRRLPAHPHAAAEIPRLPRQYSGGDRRDGSARRQRLYRGMGACAAGARRPYRRALGRHQQHQRARYRHPRGRQEPHAPHAGGGADAICSMHAKLIPAAFRDRLRTALDRTLGFAERVAAEPALEDNARQAASALYHVTSAVLMTWEAAQPGADARRALYARLVLDHRLGAQDPLEPGDGEGEREVAELVLSQRPVTLAQITRLLS